MPGITAIPNEPSVLRPFANSVGPQASSVPPVLHGTLGSVAFIRTNPHANATSVHACGQQFDDLTDTIFEGHHQPLRAWILCLYFMGLNLSNEQIAAELDLVIPDIHAMTTTLREGIVKKKNP